VRGSSSTNSRYCRFYEAHVRSCAIVYTGGAPMAPTVTMTVRLPVEVKERLERLAHSTERSKAYLAGRAIEEYLETQEWQVRAIQEAVCEADGGAAGFVEHDAVTSRVLGTTARERKIRKR